MSGSCRGFLIVTIACYAATFVKSDDEGVKEVVKLSAKECFEYGFIQDTLNCESCEALEKHVDNAALLEECKLCCSTINDDALSSANIVSAVLEVCK